MNTELFVAWAMGFFLVATIIMFGDERKQRLGLAIAIFLAVLILSAT